MKHKGSICITREEFAAATSRHPAGVVSRGRVVGLAGASRGLVKGASRVFLRVLECLRGAVEKSSTEIAGSFGKTRANSLRRNWRNAGSDKIVSFFEDRVHSDI